MIYLVIYNTGVVQILVYCYKKINRERGDRELHY